MSQNIRTSIKKSKEELGKKSVLRVISTQLIEAGVDIDFPIVFRQEAGLDSILQAAGRCNREGKIDMGYSYVFSLEKEHPLPPGYISHVSNACKNMKIKEIDDVFSPAVMVEYFKQLYYRVPSFDQGPNNENAMIQDLLYKPVDFYFKTASQQFKLIDDNSISVIVNWENSAELIETLKEKGPYYQLMKQLVQYSVCIRKHDFEMLVEDGLIEEIIEGIYWLPDRERYNAQTGLTTQNHWLEELLIK